MKLLHQRQIWGNTKATYLNPTIINKIQKEKKKMEYAASLLQAKGRAYTKTLRPVLIIRWESWDG